MDKRRNDIKANKALNLYNEGYSHEEIAKKLGSTRQSIHGLIKKRPGYSPRKRTPAKYKMFKGVKYTEKPSGYYQATTKNREMMHRAVWIHYHGEIPENHDIHHKDHDRSNNKIGNLELLSKQEHAKRFSSGSNQYQKKPRKW